VLYLPVSATLQGIGDDPVVVRDKSGFVPLRKTSKNRTWDCGLLGSTHRIMFGGEKSWKQLCSSRGTRHDDDDDDHREYSTLLYNKHVNVCCHFCRTLVMCIDMSWRLTNGRIIIIIFNASHV